MSRQNISFGSTFEKSIGFSRAVRTGPIITVSGTAPLNEDGTTACTGDLYGQTIICLKIMQQAIEAGGGRLEDVIRTRIYLTNIDEWKAAARAHGEIFSHIRPSCTFLGVQAFIGSDWLIETEADCWVPDIVPSIATA